MSEVKELKKQNKQLKKLLRNAVELLNRYKVILENAGGGAPKAKVAAKRPKAKKTKKKQAS